MTRAAELEPPSRGVPAGTGGRSALGRAILTVAAALAYALVVRSSFELVQRRIWNYLGVVDLLALGLSIAPFLLSRWVRPLRTRAARLAWWLCALLALDALCFAVAVLAPTRGHPPLEAVLSLFVGYGKLALIPAALACLLIAAARGERALAVLLGCACLASETVYTLGNPDEPLGWFALLVQG